MPLMHASRKTAAPCKYRIDEANPASEHMKLINAATLICINNMFVAWSTRLAPPQLVNVCTNPAACAVKMAPTPKINFPDRHAIKSAMDDTTRITDSAMYSVFPIGSTRRASKKLCTNGNESDMSSPVLADLLVIRQAKNDPVERSTMHGATIDAVALLDTAAAEPATKNAAAHSHQWIARSFVA